jgi:hypothetical protein
MVKCGENKYTPVPTEALCPLFLLPAIHKLFGYKEGKNTSALPRPEKLLRSYTKHESLVSTNTVTVNRFLLYPFPSVIHYQPIMTGGKAQSV